MFKEKDRLSQLLTIAAIGMGVGFGSCGLSVAMGAGERISGYIAMTGAGLFFLSAVLLVIGFVAMLIRWLTRK